MEDWKQRLMEGLKDSHLLLLILSPNYLNSDYCEWEIVEYLKYEYARATQGDGVAQIYFMEIPGLDEPGFQDKAKAWLEKVSRRQRFDFRPWYNDGADSLKETDVKNRLEELKKSLRERIQRMRRIANAPGNLPAPNVRFVGREREMKLLHESVGLGKFGVLTAVHGMGGLGKTAIAFQYAYAYADFYPGGRWQIGCANETNLAAVLNKLELDLKITFTEDEKKDDIRGAKRILNELEALAFKGVEVPTYDKKAQKPAVLLLLDNVDHAELLQLPDVALISGKPWLKVLMTTRMGPEELGADETRQTLLTIDELPFGDALSLIESYQPRGRFKNEEEKAKAGKIVGLLGCFTLAVEVAALYLYERKGQISCADFLELLKRKGNLEGIDFAGDKTKAKTAIDHTKLISATLSPTLDLLSPAETLVLSYAALLPPDSIPLPWIKTLVTKDFPELGESAEIGEDDPWLLIVNHLLSLRLLQIVDLDGQTPRVVRMHRIVQETMLKRFSTKDELLTKISDLAIDRSDYLEDHWHIKNEQWDIKPLVTFTEFLLNKSHGSAARLVKSLGQWLIYIYPANTYRVLHLQAIDLLNQNPNSEQTEVAILLSNLAYSEYELGHYQLAKDFIKKAIAIDEKFREPTHHFLAIRYNTLALIERSLGNYASAKGLNLKAIAIKEKVFGKDHPDLANYYNNLALVEHSLGNLSEAKELNLKAIAIIEKVFGKEHPHLAQSYSNLATIENSLGNLIEAKELILKAIAIGEKVFEKDHPDLATRYSNLANVEQSLGNLFEAKELNLKAIAIRQKVLGMDHPDLATSYSILASVERSLGNLTEAKELNLKAIAIREKVLGMNHPVLATSYSNLAEVERFLQNFSQAKVLNLKAIEIREEILGLDHPDLATNYNNLALVEDSLGNHSEAKELYLKAIAIRERVLGKENPNLAINYSNLALVEKDLGNLFESKELNLKAIAIREKVLGTDHPDLATSYSNLASVENSLGNLKESRELYLRAIAIEEKVLGMDHPDLATSYSNLASVEQSLGNLSEAKELNLKAIAIREKVLGMDHPELATSYNNLGRVEEDLGNLSEAKNLLLKAVSIWEEGHPHLAIGYANLASVEKALGNLVEAEEWQQKADLLKKKVQKN